MAEESNSSNDKKLLEKSPLGGVAVPIAIILIGALIIFGVTRMLSNERSYKTLVKEIQSKTFGNRWVAAYELSKVFASSSIPEEDIPWVIENLSETYKTSQDERTRNFIVLALGSLKTQEVVPFLLKALDDSNEKVKFNAIVSLGNLPREMNVDWSKVKQLLNSDDPGIKQVAILALSQHRVKGADNLIIPLLRDDDRTVRYAASAGLVHYKRDEAIATINEIFNLKYSKDDRTTLTEAQIESLKMNVLNAAQKTKWSKLESLMRRVASEDKNVKISTKAQEVLNLLKN